MEHLSSEPPPCLCPSPCQIKATVQSKGTSLIVPDAKLLAQYYRTRLGLCCGSLRLAKREVRALQQLLPGSTAAALLKVQLELTREHPRKGLKLLMPLLQEPGVMPR